MSYSVITEKLQQLGLALPPIPKPAASYIPSKRAGNLIFVSGQLPLKDGKLLMTGPMTPERAVAEAQAAMAQCFLNGLAAAALCGDLDRIEEVIRLGAFVASVPEFTEQHLVANGASELAQAIFGDRGVHARAAVGVSSLPLNAAVELEIIFQLG